ncbi:MAG: hypothetical protein ACE5HD_06375 [Acidobacteriota bacterium]
MRTMTSYRATLVLALLGAGLIPARAHLSPTVVLVKKKEVLGQLLPGAETFQGRELLLSRTEIKSLSETSGLHLSREPVRFYRGEDAGGVLLGTVLFTVGDSVHGPVEVAVALDGSGAVIGFQVTRCSAEVLPWVRTVQRTKVLEPIIGTGAGEARGPEDLPLGDLAPLTSMARFYARVIREGIFKALALSRWIRPPDDPRSGSGLPMVNPDR